MKHFDAKVVVLPAAFPLTNLANLFETEFQN